MLRLRSWTSSMITTAYLRRFLSVCSSRSRMPSVMNLIFVCADSLSVKRTLYPTSDPGWHDICDATKEATDVAAIRRGCVMPIVPRCPKPASRQIRGSCVVLPDPVSPATTTTWEERIARRISSFLPLMGRPAGTSGPVMAGVPTRGREITVPSQTGSVAMY